MQSFFFHPVNGEFGIVFFALTNIIHLINNRKSSQRYLKCKLVHFFPLKELKQFLELFMY